MSEVSTRLATIRDLLARKDSASALVRLNRLLKEQDACLEPSAKAWALELKCQAYLELGEREAAQALRASFSKDLSYTSLRPHERLEFHERMDALFAPRAPEALYWNAHGSLSDTQGKIQLRCRRGSRLHRLLEGLLEGPRRREELLELLGATPTPQSFYVLVSRVNARVPELIAQEQGRYRLARPIERRTRL